MAPAESERTSPLRYWYFPGCSQETSAGYAQSLDALCGALGLQLQELPGWECCGASAFFSLDRGEALSRVARILGLAERQSAAQLITGCNGCYSTLARGREMILADPRIHDRLRQSMDKEGLSLEAMVPVRHLLEVLAQEVPPGVWDEALKSKGPQELPGSLQALAPYYGCLFSRTPGSRDDPQHPVMLDTLLQRLGFTVIDHGAKTACCGASHMLAHPQATRELIRSALVAMRHKGATAAATICPLCQFNLDSGQRGLGLQPFPVLFFTQAAGLALGLPVDSLGLDKLLVRIE